jgi:hypothetical protein
MTQTLMDSLSGVVILFPRIVDVSKFTSDFASGENLKLWLIETEKSGRMTRWRGVDMKNDWVLVYLDISEDYGYICIPAKSIKDVTEERLRSIYCDIAKRLGAIDVLFYGVSLLTKEMAS